MPENQEADRFTDKIKVSLAGETNSEERIRIITQVFIDHLEQQMLRILPSEAVLDIDPETLGDYFYNLIGLEGLPSPAVSALSPTQKTNLVELTRAFDFLSRYEFNQLERDYWSLELKTVVKYYALKSHLSRLVTPLEPDTQTLFDLYFGIMKQEIDPTKTYSETVNLEICDTGTFYGSFWYDCFLFEKQRDAISNELVFTTHQDYVNQLVPLVRHHEMDASACLGIMLDVYNVIRRRPSEDHDKIKFFKDIGELAKKGNLAAASLLISFKDQLVQVEYDSEINQCIYKLTPDFAQFSKQDLWFFLSQSLLLNIYSENNDCFVSFFENLDQIFPIQEEDVQYMLDTIIKNQDHFNVLFGYALAKLIEKTKSTPSLKELHDSCRKQYFLSILKIRSDANPILRSKDIVPFPDDMKENFESIKSTTAILHQAARTGHVFFSTLPPELREKIAAHTKDEIYFSQSEAEDIASGKRLKH